MIGLLLLLAPAMRRETAGSQRITSVVVMNDHAEALAAWVEAAADAQLPPGPYAVLHVDRHSDMNTPSSVFTSTPVGHRNIHVDAEEEQRRLAPLHAAAIHEADLASFQMAGVWAGVVSSVAWVFGNSSEPFLLTPTGSLEAMCSGFACPLREWLQSDSATGSFTITPRLSPADVQQRAWQGGDTLRWLETEAVSGLELNQAPLLPSAPFDFWIGHIDQPETISNAHEALSSPPSDDATTQGQPSRATPNRAAWVLDIDLDAFMPARFSHRSPPWAYGGQLHACSRYLYRSLCHRWSSPAGKNCSLWQHVAEMFHGIRPGGVDEHAAVVNTEAKTTSQATHGNAGLSEQCHDDIRNLARRWRQIANENPALGDVGKRLSPPELLLWMQAYDSASPTVLAEGDSATDLILKAELAHLPRFISRLESLLRGLQGSHSHLVKTTGATADGLGPPAAITIARSPDGFAPIETIPYIEGLVMGMLDRLYAPTRQRPKRASSTLAPSSAPGGAGKSTGAQTVTEGGLLVRYTAETAPLADLRDIVDWLQLPVSQRW